jgi:3-hydroxyacyl-CoA dehydrogenase
LAESRKPACPQVVLVGAGVVGCAILRAHLDAGIDVGLADQQEDRLQQAVAQMGLPHADWQVETAAPLGDQIPMLRIRRVNSGAMAANTDQNATDHPLVIESISERLEVKQSFLAEAERWLGRDAVLCTNTSTLRIGTLAAGLSHPDRLCGMHFFMPVSNRDAVELACGEQTSQATIERCIQHVRRLNKQPLVVRDGPGFVVNRLLSPYLNEAMLLLCRGVSAARIERACLRYGMPLSPLELIDWIGTRTMFDAGRVFWQAFPGRIQPAAMLGALIKCGRLGRWCGKGLYDYSDDVSGRRSDDLAPEVLRIVDRYRRDEVDISDDDVLHLLSIPMWIEAALARREGMVESAGQLELAMHGGLGYDAYRSWLGFFDGLGSTQMMSAIARWSDLTPAIRAPDELVVKLQRYSPSEALRTFSLG